MSIRLQIERPYIEAMIANFPVLTPYAEQLRFGDKVEIAFDQLDPQARAFLHDLYLKAGPAMAARAAHIATLRRAFDDTATRFGEGDLKSVLPAIVRYLAGDAVRGWMFTATAAGRSLPYVVSRIDYTPPANDEAGRVFVELKANAKGAITTTTIRISAGDVVGKTVAELFAAKGFLKETPELIVAYDAAIERYFAWRGKYGEQYSGRGTGFFAEDPNASHRDTDWSRKDLIVLSSSGGAARLVNDEGILQLARSRSNLPAISSANICARRPRAISTMPRTKSRNPRPRSARACSARFQSIAYILMFHLELHHHVWVHVDDISPTNISRS